MPFFECAEGIFEIDEFDVSSIFVIVGERRALVIDTGCGIGDLRWLIEHKITDKPYDLVLSHNHGDHMGGAAWFDRAYIHPADMRQTDRTVSPTLQFRKSFARMIAKREGKHYAYDVERDIRPWPKDPALVPMKDGQTFDLGGRAVTAIHCPGHTPGEMVFYDDRTRTLLAGDALNEYFLLSGALADTLEARAAIAIAGLERIRDMSDRIDRIFNFHHDYRGYGQPLAEDVLPLLLDGLRGMRDGTAVFEERPDPLSDTGKTNAIVRSGRVAISSLSGKLRDE